MAMAYKPVRNKKGVFIPNPDRISKCTRCQAFEANVQIVQSGKYKGLCIPCRRKQYHADNREKSNERCREYYHSQNGLTRMKERWYHGNYMNTLRRDSFQCAVCQATKDLTLHHRDRTGIKSVGNYTDGNCDLNNLVTVCRSCHSKYHNKTLPKQFAQMLDPLRDASSTKSL